MYGKEYTVNYNPYTKVLLFQILYQKADIPRAHYTKNPVSLSKTQRKK